MAYFDLLTSIENDSVDQNNDEDFLIALQLQDQFNREEQENEKQLDKITQVTLIFLSFHSLISKFLRSIR